MESNAITFEYVDTIHSISVITEKMGPKISYRLEPCSVKTIFEINSITSLGNKWNMKKDLFVIQNKTFSEFQ